MAVDASPVKPKVKRTLHAMAEHAGAKYTTMDRLTVLELIGGRREATVSDHWRQARANGLLASNSASTPRPYISSPSLALTTPISMI